MSGNMVVREVFYSRMLSFWRACARTKTGNGRTMRDPVTARFYSPFGTVNLAIFELLPIAGFLLAPQVSASTSGPAAILSAILASLAAILTGFAFVDLRCRFWKTVATSYDYVYKTGSEATAFAVAWCSIAHQVALTAAAVRTCSQSINYLVGQRLTALTLSVFDRVSTYDAPSVVDVLGFMICMVTWSLVSLRWTVPTGKVVVLLHNSATVLTLAAVTVASVVYFRLDHWNGGDNVVVPNGYTGVVSGAALLYLSFPIFENLSKFIEYKSSKSYALHIKSSIIGIAILGLVLTTVSSTITLVGPTSNITTEQPFAETFDLSSVLPWTKYVVCVATVVLLVPIVLIIFDRCVLLFQFLAEDGLVAQMFAEDDESSERSVLSCIVVGLLSGLGSMWFSVVLLCRFSATFLLVEHLVVLVTVLTVRYRPNELTSPEASRSPGSPAAAGSLGNGYALLRSCDDNQNDRTSGTDDRTSGSGKDRDRSEQQCSGNSYEFLLLGKDGSHRQSESTTSSAELQDEQTTSRSDPQGGATVVPNRETGLADGYSSDTDIDVIVEEYLENIMSDNRFVSEDTSTVRKPTPKSHRNAIFLTSLHVVCSLTLAAIFAHAQSYFRAGQALVIVAALVIAMTIVLDIVLLYRQPESETDDEFGLKFRGLSFVYQAAIFLNCVLLVTLVGVSSIVFACWTFLGLTIYVCYGSRHSRSATSCGRLPDEQSCLLPMTSSSYTKERRLAECQGHVGREGLLQSP